MKKVLLTSTAVMVLAAASSPDAFMTVYTQSKSALYISDAAQNSDLTQTQYEALTWVEIKGVGSVGEYGESVNILNYDTWDDDVVQKQKGMANAGDPEIELARSYNDAGQAQLRTAAATSDKWAFKIVRNDKPTSTGTPTILYHRGLVSGPRRPNGRNEDFDLEVFTLGLVQREIVDNAAT